MLALQKFGVEWVLATSVVGGLRPSLSSGQLVLVDQFLDFTRHRPGTIFGKEKFQFMDFTEPYCPTLRHAILDVAKQLDMSILPEGCYVGVDGPRYETAAEVRMYQMLGGDVIGMSNIPETIFARELGLHYSTVAVVSNPGAGLSGSPVLIEDINAATIQTNERLLNLLFNAAEKIIGADKCKCIPETRMIIATPAQ
jgi:5'-methylthioadenosine phosphorylase